MLLFICLVVVAPLSGSSHSHSHSHMATSAALTTGMATATAMAATTTKVPIPWAVRYDIVSLCHHFVRATRHLLGDLGRLTSPG